MPKRRSGTKAKPKTEVYKHPEAELLLRPEVGTQAQFRKKKLPKKYRYDDSLSPVMEWDGQNSARVMGEWLLAMIEQASRLEPPHTFSEPQQLKDSSGSIIALVTGLQDAVEQLKRIVRPFLDWAGKAERLSFDVPTLPLFVHERLSTKAILETLKGHKRDRQFSMFDLYGTEEHSITDQVLRAYEHKDNWINRMILGDSLVVMNSLLQYEGLGGQVQMIYMDPPYGVKFGSNFQPFVRKRAVKHNDDADMTREPEMVQAYRDTWELGLHSYLTYMRDRLLVARELLSSSGSIFVQISADNLHHVRELLDEIFDTKNFVSLISYATSGGFETSTLSRAGDYLLWYAKDKDRIRYQNLFEQKKDPLEDPKSKYDQLELADGTRRALLPDEKDGTVALPANSRIFRVDTIVSQGSSKNATREYVFEGETYDCGPNNHWKASVPKGMDRLASEERIVVSAKGKLGYVRYYDDFPFVTHTNIWTDIGGAVQSRSDPKIYSVQTGTSLIQRCMLMTTRPGDLVLDPTSGSGTTAFVAEQWGRRWIMIDTSRVPLALSRQRLLTATFPYYQLIDEVRGPIAGLVYLPEDQSTNPKSLGPGIVPHVKLETVANEEPPAEEVLVDHPELNSKITRVTGPFCFEATIPTPIDWEGDGVEDSGAGVEYADFVARMLEVLRRSPILRVDGGKTITLKNVRPPAKTLSLSAEAMVDATAPGQSPTIAEAFAEADEKNRRMLPVSQKLVALVFGPENGAISEKLVFEAAKEAGGKSYSHLYVIGFAIQPNARKLVQECEEAMGIAATYIQATPDLMMGDLLKNMRSSQIFSVCGLPEIKIKRADRKANKDADEPDKYQVSLLGLDTFDPATMETVHRDGNDVPAWFLDTDYNGLCFHVSQAFFPRTSAWDDLKRMLKTEYEQSVWQHLAGTTSAPFEAAEHAQVAVKVIDDRGNELLVVKSLKEIQ
ncbi:MAG TPA: site-specific DNA-methyltransferase [Pyrinomonadaceae bacterium]|nr:site-specific DNA-methyltransferase [Pyrinomonadaceae bacterium]